MKKNAQFSEIKSKKDMFALLDMLGGEAAKLTRWQFACISQGKYPPPSIEEFMANKDKHPDVVRMFDGLVEGH